MAVTINAVKDIEGLSVDVTVAGLVATGRYDVHRMQARFIGEDPDTLAPLYEREIPDRPELWTSVAHRVGWEPGKTTVVVRDYECPLRPTQYYVCASSAIGPYEHDWDTGDYPVSRGVLGSQIIHFSRDLTSLQGPTEKGHITVRSIRDLGAYITLCVVDISELRYTARGTELAVVGNRFPVFVTDIRESRRGSITFRVRDLGQFNRLRAILFPTSGRISPVMFHAASGDPTMLLDDMRVVPLDVTIEQMTPTNADSRYVHVDFIEIDGSAPTPHRTGDNDDLVTAPKAVMTISDTTPNVGQVVTLSEGSSTGQYDKWAWSFDPNPNNYPMGVSYARGPHKIKYGSKGKKRVKLLLSGPAGSHSVTKTLTVG